MTNFNGFTSETFQFFADITENNNKEWFTANKKRYQEHVQQPAQLFIESLGERLKTLSDGIRYSTALNGSGSMLRIYRDVRFSKDKTPYKTNLGISWWEGHGKKMQSPGYFFHLDKDGAWIAGGLYMFPKDVVDPYRRAVLNDFFGPRLEDIIAESEASGYPIYSHQQYKKVPRGYDADHPRAELLKHKGLIVDSKPIPKDVLMTPQIVETAFEHCKHIYPLQHWFVDMLRWNEYEG